jgi:hypothetical protein
LLLVPEPPQAAKMMAVAMASNETRIECNDMKFFLCGTK